MKVFANLLRQLKQKREILEYYRLHIKDRSGYKPFLEEAELRYPDECRRIRKSLKIETPVLNEISV